MGKRIARRLPPPEAPKSTEFAWKAVPIGSRPSAFRRCTAWAHIPSPRNRSTTSAIYRCHPPSISVQRHPDPENRSKPVSKATPRRNTQTTSLLIFPSKTSHVFEEGPKKAQRSHTRQVTRDIGAASTPRIGCQAPQNLEPLLLLLLFFSVVFFFASRRKLSISKPSLGTHTDPVVPSFSRTPSLFTRPTLGFSWVLLGDPLRKPLSHDRIFSPRREQLERPATPPPLPTRFGFN